MILDSLDLEQIKFKLELKTNFKIRPSIFICNSVTQPFLILLCDSSIIICFCLPKKFENLTAVEYTFVQKEFEHFNQYLLR